MPVFTSVCHWKLIFIYSAILLVCFMFYPDGLIQQVKALIEELMYVEKG